MDAGEINVGGRPLSLCGDRPQALHEDHWITDILGALTVQVLLDYLRAWDLTWDVHLVENRMDRFCWKWTADKIFSTSFAYPSFFVGQYPVEGLGLRHKARAPAKCKFSSGLYCTTDAGQRLGGRGMVCRAMIHVLSVQKL